MSLGMMGRATLGCPCRTPIAARYPHDTYHACSAPGLIQAVCVSRPTFDDPLTHPPIKWDVRCVRRWNGRTVHSPYAPAQP
jgi:hypothetical protein